MEETFIREADLSDQATRLELLEQKELLLANSIVVASIPVGKAGICGHCELPSPRIVRSHCPRCRDLLKLP